MAENDPKTPESSPFHKAFFAGLILQLIFIFLAALILDGGYTLRVVAIFAIPYFILVLWIGHNRPQKPTPGDLFFIKFLPIFTFIAALFIGSILNAIFGLPAPWQQNQLF
ncbi:MAG: hypothetical protein PVH19_02700 [Planctomycetia bacterium]|jgi:hypothetical protein